MHNAAASALDTVQRHTCSAYWTIFARFTCSSGTAHISLWRTLERVVAVFWRFHSEGSAIWFFGWCLAIATIRNDIRCLREWVSWQRAPVSSLFQTETSNRPQVQHRSLWLINGLTKAIDSKLIIVEIIVWKNKLIRANSADALSDARACAWPPD